MEKITGKRENKTGKNVKFEIDGNKIVSLPEVERKIESGKLGGYEWVRPNDERKPFPRAKPNKTTRDNIDEQKDI